MEQHTITRIGFIGLGRMGGSMARHLHRAGFLVRGYDVAATVMQAAAADGIAMAESATAAVSDAQVVILMLPSDEALCQLMEAPGNLLAALPQGVVVIDMGTSALETSQRLAARVAQQGGAMLDAPVSGGEQGASDGTLSIMVGGPESVYEYCRPVLAAMGSVVTYIGASGQGLIAKYVNQMLMEATFCAIAEAFGLAARANADLAAVYQAVRRGLGGSPVLDQMLPQLLAGDLGRGRELALHHKDGGYALAAAELVGAWTPLTELTHTLFDAAMAAEQGSHSAAGVARVYEARSNVHLVHEAAAASE